MLNCKKEYPFYLLNKSIETNLLVIKRTSYKLIEIVLTTTIIII
jgi:hypothetical protein